MSMKTHEEHIFMSFYKEKLIIILGSFLSFKLSDLNKLVKLLIHSFVNIKSCILIKASSKMAPPITISLLELGTN